MLHELQVHQIELEMQNEELRQAQTKLESSQEKYFDLYDLAPVGYVTLSEKGLILESNLTFAALLGVERGSLVRQPISRFILSEDQDIYYHHRKALMETGKQHICELRLLKKDGGPVWVDLIATAAQEADGAPSFSRDIISGKGRILVMDDEENMRTMFGAILKRLGYQVELVGNGGKAISCYQEAEESGHPFSAVILDLTIRGGMGGKETLKQLLEVDPGVKAIVASGYSEDPVIQNYQEYGFKGALIKPFFINELSVVLLGVIGAS